MVPLLLILGVLAEPQKQNHWIGLSSLFVLNILDWFLLMNSIVDPDPNLSHVCLNLLSVTQLTQQLVST